MCISSVETSTESAGAERQSELTVSVVIPCLNEAENIEECVRIAGETIEAAGLDGEVVVVDNGSDDGSGELAAAAGARVIEERRRGYGSAYQAGFAAARGRYIVMGDADLTYDFRDVPRFVAELEGGADLVMGNRLDSIHPGAMPWLHQHVGNPLMTRFYNLLYGTGIRDVWCGMRGLRRDALPRLDLHGLGMEFAPEMVVRAGKQGLEIRQLPIEYHPRGGESKLSTFRDGWRGLRLLLVHSPALFTVPGAVMLVIGAAAMLLFVLDVQLFGRQWSLHAMIAAGLLTIAGSQVISLGLSARAFGVYYLNEPPDRVFAWGRRHLGLEKGLAVGGVLLAAGLAIAAVIVITWIDRGFGELSEEKLMMVAAVLLICGLQAIFTSFLLSVLGLRRERS